jgi:hypothetical protein
MISEAKMLDIKGKFKVRKVKIIGNNIVYELLFFKDRILFIKIGGELSNSSYLYGRIGSGAGVLAGALLGLGYAAVSGNIGNPSMEYVCLGLAAVLGFTGYFVSNRFYKNQLKEQDIKVRDMHNLSAGDLLNQDKHNFSMAYRDIFRVRIKHPLIDIGPNGARGGSLAFEGVQNGKFDILASENFVECKKIVRSCLEDKVVN